MESKLFKVFVSLGVPGLALGIFYMLFKTFDWTFPSVPSNWVGPIIVLFMLLSSGVVFYALTLWRPQPSAVSANAGGDAGSPSGAAALHKVLELIGAFLERQSVLLASQDGQAETVAEQRQRVDAAKTAVQRAANHTRHYMAGRRAGGQRDRNTERELSDEWLEVGDRLREIDGDEAQELYSICFRKARYWSDTDGWDVSYAGGMDLSIENVLRTIENITAPEPNAG